MATKIQKLYHMVFILKNRYDSLTRHKTILLSLEASEYMSALGKSKDKTLEFH